MKGAVSTVVLVLAAAVLVVAIGYNYYKPEITSPSPTGRAVTTATSTGGSTTLGYLDSCNPNRDRCGSGLICKLAGDNIYRCLR